MGVIFGKLFSSGSGYILSRFQVVKMGFSTWGNICSQNIPSQGENEYDFPKYIDSTVLGNILFRFKLRLHLANVYLLSVLSSASWHLHGLRASGSDGHDEFPGPLVAGVRLEH